MSRPLMPCSTAIRKILFNDVHHLIFLSDHFKSMMLDTKLHFFFTIITLLYGGDQSQSLWVRCFGACSSILHLLNHQNLPCVSWRLMISVFSCDSYIAPPGIFDDVCKSNN